MNRPWLWLAMVLFACATARAEDQSEARLHFDKATSAFALGRFADAANEYEKAFELKPDPALLYNAAQSHRNAGHRQRALLLYQNYIRIYGRSASNRAEVNRQIAELKRAIEVDGPGEIEPVAKPPEPAPVAAPVVTPAPMPEATPAVSMAPTPPAKKPLAKRAWFWGVIAGSAVIVGGAIALGVVFGSSTHDPTASLGAIKVAN